MTSSAVQDQIDEAARELALKAAAGQIAETDARAQVAALLLRSEMHQAVAFAYPGLAVQARHDLAENLLDALVGRVLDVESSFDLARLEAGSLCGWARKLGYAIARYDWAVCGRRGIDALVTFVDPVAPVAHGQFDADAPTDAPARAFHAAMAFGGLSAEDTVLGDWEDPERFERVLERATHLTGLARPGVRDRASAVALRDVLHLPRLCVPDSLVERAEMLELVLADPTLARRSLVQMAAMVCPEPPHHPAPGEEPVGELLLSLWDDFAADQLESLMVRPARAAHLLVVDALQPMPKPSRGATRAFARAVRCVSRTSDWRMVQDGMVAAFLATCTEPVSAFDDTNDEDAKAALVRAARDAAARWPFLAARAAAFPGAPLGGSPQQVTETMRSLLEDAVAQDTEARVASRHRCGTAGSPQADAA